jgi:hypothetical protein
VMNPRVWGRLQPPDGSNMAVGERTRKAGAGRPAGDGVDFPCEKIAPALSASLPLAWLGVRARSACESLPPCAPPRLDARA